MLKLTAMITWKGHEAGGLTTKPFSGIQPSFRVADDLIISQVFGMEGSEEMPVGKECLVEIRLPYGEVYQDSIVPGLEFTLNVGSRIVASGRVLGIV